MNRVILFIFSIAVSQLLYAQSGDLVVQGAGKDMHLVHTVAPKENWYSIGRIYNISPKEIAPFNHLTLESALSIGQHLNIPLTAVNFTKDGSKAVDEVFVPVHQVKSGSKLVVGYLKVKAALSPLADKATSPVIAKAAEKPVIKPDVKPTPKPETKITPVEEKKTEPIVTTVSTNVKGSYFKSQYEPSGKNSSGNTGIFKSTSGWQDGKFYALMNNVPVGTIVKVTNPSSDKIVYAKVLGNLADMKENAGLVARISDAAASELGGEGKFEIEVKY